MKTTHLNAESTQNTILKRVRNFKQLRSTLFNRSKVLDFLNEVLFDTTTNSTENKSDTKHSEDA
jgi:hypothetical protein